MGYIFTILLSAAIATKSPPTPPVADSEIAEFTQYINRPLNYTPIPRQNNMTHISIDMDNPLDMNWSGMLTVNGNGPTPVDEQITLPFLHDRTINNLNIKFDATIMRF